MVTIKNANLNARTVQFRLLASVIGVSAVFFVLFGAAAVTKISDLTRSKVNDEALALIHHRAYEIESFINQRGRVVTTVLSNPTLLGWMADYDQFRRPLEGDATYSEIINFFAAVEAADPSISSVFFATDATSEYFRSSGRVEREGYDPKSRWWWREAVEQDRLYVSPPGVDAGTGQVTVSVQTTVALPDGRLLGIGGIDVLLGTLGEVVEKITYEDVGHAFLVDGAGNLIYFPQLDLAPEGPDARFSTHLSEVDHLCLDSAGFGELALTIKTRTSGMQRVRWMGDDRIVVHSPVSAESPFFEWSLGLMVPEQLITAAIVRAKVQAALTVFIAVTTIAGFTLFITNRINGRLREEARRRADVLAEANVRLLEADRMKSQFLATMSHELRTPLNSIIGFSEILRSRIGDELDPTFRRFLDNIHSSGEHLLSMISDILDLSNVEAGKMDLHPETVDVPATLEAVCNIVHGLARERRVSVRVEADETLPLVEVDLVRFKQILFNLLSNAVKFSLDGSTVKVAARALDEQASVLGAASIEVAVIDHGIGITGEDQEMVFDEFRQVDGTGARKPGGTGLGLALVKRLVEMHHGTVAVHSTVGEGSTFTVTLPVNFGGSGIFASPVDSGPPPERPAGRTVLVVEDDDSAFQQIRDS